MTTEALFDAYYDRLARRTGWEETIAEDFAFTGGAPHSGSRGKAGYVEAVHRFYRVFESVSVKQSIVQGEAACVIATYGLISPSGKRTTMDIAEIWATRNGQLASLIIYFDTASWNTFMAS